MISNETVTWYDSVPSAEPTEPEPMVTKGVADKSVFFVFGKRRPGKLISLDADANKPPTVVSLEIPTALFEDTNGYYMTSKIMSILFGSGNDSK